LLNDADLVILDNNRSVSTGLAGELADFVSSGGSLLLVPSEEADLEMYNNTLVEFGLGRILPYDTVKLAVTDLDATHKMFEGVFEELPENLDLPEVNGHFPLRSTGNSYLEVIMDLQNGDPYLILSNYGKGKVYLMTTPLGDPYGNLTKHAVWVPVLYRMAMMSRPVEHLFYTMGNDMSVNSNIELNQEEGQLTVSLLGDEYEFIPAISGSGMQQKLMLFDRIKQAGHYAVYSSGEQQMGFSFNYDRMESDPIVLRREEIEEIYENQESVNTIIIDSPDDHAGYDFIEISHGRDLWKVFIWFALFFILLEILLLRLFRK
jgi:hypothetical protein